MLLSRKTQLFTGMYFPHHTLPLWKVIFCDNMNIPSKLALMLILFIYLFQFIKSDIIKENLYIQYNENILQEMEIYFGFPDSLFHGKFNLFWLLLSNIKMYLNKISTIYDIVIFNVDSLNHLFVPFELLFVYVYKRSTMLESQWKCTFRSLKLEVVLYLITQSLNSLRDHSFFFISVLHCFDIIPKLY